MVVLDVSNPAAPIVLGKTLPMPDIILDIVVAGDFTRMWQILTGVYAW